MAVVKQADVTTALLGISESLSALAKSNIAILEKLNSQPIPVATSPKGKTATKAKAEVKLTVSAAEVKSLWEKDAEKLAVVFDGIKKMGAKFQPTANPNNIVNGNDRSISHNFARQLNGNVQNPVKVKNGELTDDQNEKAAKLLSKMVDAGVMTRKELGLK